MSVKELKQEWLDQLKMKIYYDDDPLKIFALPELLTGDEVNVIADAETWFDIPNEIVYKVFDGVDFVKGDFESD